MSLPEELIAGAEDVAQHASRQFVARLTRILATATLLLCGLVGYFSWSWFNDLVSGFDREIESVNERTEEIADKQKRVEQYIKCDELRYREDKSGTARADDRCLDFRRIIEG